MAALLCAALALSMAGCGGAPRRERTWYTWFDTVTTLIGYGSEKEFDRACGLVGDVLERYHTACDIYHEYSGDANAMTLNRRAGEGPIAVAPELLEVLEWGKSAYPLTEGMFNIAMGAVLSLWHDCREAAEEGFPALPERAALEEAAKHCRIDDLILDASAGTAALADGAMSIDLGAVAKGYAAERAALALKEAGFTGYALSVGGNVRTVGSKPGGDAWVAGVEDPRDESEEVYFLRVSLSDSALVTSGSYQRFFTVEGARYHHIISPETLYPKNAFLSVSVLCPDSALADALSTALFNMDLETGLNYVNQMEDVEVCWVLADGTARFSEGFEEYVLP